MSAENVIRGMNQAKDVASVRQVFGEPQTIGERMVIPIASVTYAFGFGYGSGPARADDNAESVEAGGGGGGGRAVARPVAVLEATPTETTIKPIEDRTGISLAGIAMVAWNIFWITLTIRKFAKARK